jgi:UDP-N-acetylglucosamine 2-epimerase
MCVRTYLQRYGSVAATPQPMRAPSRLGAVKQLPIHTGQHPDRPLSDDFFYNLELPAADADLRIGSASHPEQTGQVTTGLEPKRAIS